jgi:alpha-galactosidase
MKIVIIGAGSAFGSRLSIDILSRKPIEDSTIALCDPHAERLETVRAYVQSAVDHHKLPARVEASTDRREVLPGADFIVIAVSIGGPAYHGKPFEDEFGIPSRYGVVQTVADTVGPGGVFRTLRSAPELIAMCRDANELCPGAQILNYTNPMAMLTWVLSLHSEGPVAGLCHGVQGTSKKMARYIDAPYEEVGYWVGGINHMAWFVEFTHNKQDAYPRLFKAMEDPKTYDQDPVRFDLLKAFGYFCTESSRHALEYFPYFRKDSERVERFRKITLGVKGKRQTWYEDMGVKIEDAGSIQLKRSHEYASGIMEAMATGVPFRFNGNVMNDDLVDGLPRGCCVEVPCLTDAQGVHPCHFGALPAQCVALCRTNVNVQDLAVRAVLDRDREAAYHAVLLDPLTAANCSLDDARRMFEEMWEAEKHLLSYYEG